MAAIEFQRVTCRSQFSNLDQLSFAAEEGETTCLLGPSGSGKTLIAAITAGLARADDGTVRVFGQDPYRSDVASRRCSFVFGTKSLPDRLFLDDFLLHASRLFGFSEDDARKALRLLDLYELRHSRLINLSPYRREIAKFLVPLCRKPDLLVVDGMDQKIDVADMEFIYSRIFEMSREEGTSVFLTCSSKKAVESYADRFMELSEGKIGGSSFLSKMTPGDNFTLCRIRVSDVVAGSRLLNAIGVEGNSIVLRQPSDGFSSLFRILEENGVQVLSFERLKEEGHDGRKQSVGDS